MKKKLPLFILLSFFSVLNAQTEIKRVGAISSKSYPVNNPENPSTNTIIPYNTICFEEKESAEVVAMSKLNFNCSIKKFASVKEAETFAYTFKNSDQNISQCTLIENKSGLFFFNFSVKEPKSVEWYLQLFQKNNLAFVKNNSDLRSIDELLIK
jgi:hypothetical protein